MESPPSTFSGSFPTRMFTLPSPDCTPGRSPFASTVNMRHFHAGLLVVVTTAVLVVAVALSRVDGASSVSSAFIVQPSLWGTWQPLTRLGERSVLGASKKHGDINSRTGGVCRTHCLGLIPTIVSALSPSSLCCMYVEVAFSRAQPISLDRRLDVLVVLVVLGS